MAGKPKKRCKRKHRLEGENLYISKNGVRQCKACALRRTRQARKAKKTAWQVP